MARESITTGVTAGNKRRAATHYGRRNDEGPAMSQFQVEQGVYKQVTTFKFDALPSAEADELYQSIPAGSRIISAVLKTTETFVGGTSLSVGVSTVDGTTFVDADGILLPATAVVADLVEGYFLDGDGALIGAKQSIAQDVKVVVVAAGTFTAGEATLTVTYETLEDRNQTMNG